MKRMKNNKQGLLFGVGVIFSGVFFTFNHFRNWGIFKKKKYEIDDEIAKGRVDEIFDKEVIDIRKLNEDSLNTLRDEEIKKELIKMKMKHEKNVEFIKEMEEIKK